MGQTKSAFALLRDISDVDIVIATHATHDVLSQTVEYALRATLYIARQKPRVVSLHEVARAIQAPSRYLAKILSQLTREGYLESSRGRDGGFRIAPRHANASLASIVAVFELTEPHRCLLGLGVCGQDPSCTVHEKWAPIARSTSAFFAGTTIDELLLPRTST